MPPNYSSQKNLGDVSNRPVNASTPVGVISRVCSNCADLFPSCVAAVHLSCHDDTQRHQIMHLHRVYL